MQINNHALRGGILTHHFLYEMNLPKAKILPIAAIAPPTIIAASSADGKGPLWKVWRNSTLLALFFRVSVFRLAGLLFFCFLFLFYAFHRIIKMLAHLLPIASYRIIIRGLARIVHTRTIIRKYVKRTRHTLKVVKSYPRFSFHHGSSLTLSQNQFIPLTYKTNINQSLRGGEIL